MARHTLFLFLLGGWFVMVPALVAYREPIATTIVLLAAFTDIVRHQPQQHSKNCNDGARRPGLRSRVKP